MNKALHRILCWDEKLIEKSENIQICTHKLTKINIVLSCDNEWEGVHNGYASVIKIGDRYRIYYRADSLRPDSLNLQNRSAIRTDELFA